MKRLLLAFYSTGILFFPAIIYSQQWDLRGQLTSSSNLHNDLSGDNTEIDQRVGYIPTLSIYPEYQFLNNIDFEVAYNLQTNFDGFLGTGDKRIDSNNEIHRLWARYSSDRIEFRYGIQKIAFGPGLILRPLRWFDSLDPKDPTGQTDGVTAVRVRYFGELGITYSGWMIHPEDRDISSRGGRMEIPISGVVELGASYHHRPAYLDGQIPERSGIPFGIPFAGEDRYGIDLRVDIVIGLWAEGTVSNSFDGDILFESKTRIYMVGGDYTFPIGNGIYFLAEYQKGKVKPKKIFSEVKTEISAFMVNYPIGVFDSITLITEVDWESERQFKFIQYSRIYDNFDFNVIVGFNPERNEFSDEELLLSNFTQFGNNVQLIIIYNH